MQPSNRIIERDDILWLIAENREAMYDIETTLQEAYDGLSTWEELTDREIDYLPKWFGTIERRYRIISENTERLEQQLVKYFRNESHESPQES